MANFVAIDSDSFSILLKGCEKGPAACYQIKNNQFIFLMGSHGDNWPITTSARDYYTSDSAALPVGWHDLPKGLATAVNWPKDVKLYFPEQTFSNVKLAFTAIIEPTLSPKVGELDGLFEAISHRLSSYLGEIQIKAFLDQVHVEERMRTLDRNLAQLVNHELRTPLSSIRGYAALLANPSGRDSAEAYAAIIEAEVKRSLKAIDRINLFLYQQPATESSKLEAIDMELLCQQTATAEITDFTERTAGIQQRAAKVSVYNSDPGHVFVHANRAKLELAIGEVIKNAIAFSNLGLVEIKISNSDGTVVIDIIDDGAGVAPGTEDLIFLNFFQDPSTQPVAGSPKGLGLGLFLARSIIEEHLGQLDFIRSKGRMGFFRFLIPAGASTKTASQARSA